MARPGWLAALPHHLKEEDEDEEEDEAGRMADRRGAALLFAGCWSIGAEVVARCGDGIALNRTGWPSVPLPERRHKRAKW